MAMDMGMRAKMAKDKKKGISDMEMPSKRGDELSVDDAAAADDGEMNAADDSEMAADTGAETSNSNADLSGLSDEDLMAEVEKRGLMSQLDRGSEPGADDMSMDMEPAQKGRPGKYA